jgi:isopentenyl diphosphate isomerase/L-lactate dehydrogenase-like FMN-dependent dehydrogenase
MGEAPPPGPGQRRQGEVYYGGLRGRRPAVPVDARRLEERARRTLRPEAFGYLAGGAGLETTMARNRAAFDEWRILPRFLRDVSRRDLSVDLFGRRLEVPFLLAPIGALELAHPDADLAVARAAASAGTPYVFSSQASVPMEACAAAMGEAPRWFQLYWNASDDVMRSFVRRAEACGCEAIVLTLDTTIFGWRDRDLDLAYVPFLRGLGLAQYTTDPEFMRLVDEGPVPPAPGGIPTLSQLGALLQIARAHPGSTLANLRSPRARAVVARFFELFQRPSLQWADLPRLLEATDLPVIVKGILAPEDARRAVREGVSGIVVSNHGGRQVDGAVASLDALPAVVDAVAGRVPVLFDSGIRCGADAFKALALGAQAVLVGRTYAFGLGLAGETGVREVIANLAGELDQTLGLAGVSSVAALGRDALVRAGPLAVS